MTGGTVVLILGIIAIVAFTIVHIYDGQKSKDKYEKDSNGEEYYKLLTYGDVEVFITKSRYENWKDYPTIMNDMKDVILRAISSKIKEGYKIHKRILVMMLNEGDSYTVTFGVMPD